MAIDEKVKIPSYKIQLFCIWVMSKRAVFLFYRKKMKKILFGRCFSEWSKQ